MNTLIITRGLPASGKTTYANAWMARGQPNRRVRVNRDDTRKNLYGVYWGLTYEQEQAVTVAQHASIAALLRAGHDVIVDDTNLRLKHARTLAQIAKTAGCLYRVIDFTHVGVDECVRRDDARRKLGERSVGEDVIRNMHVRYLGKGFLPNVDLDEDRAAQGYTYVPDTNQPKAWLVDIDGTLAHSMGRGPFDWHRVGEDDVDESIASLVRMLHVNEYVVLMSGRDEVCRDATKDWLRQHAISIDSLIMRPVNDTRKDSVVKLELFRNQVAPYYNVQAVFDDRDQVVAMWRSIGLPCYQVAPGAF